MASLNLLDVAIVVASLLSVFGVALYGSRKSKSRQHAAEEYFLAGRSMPWAIIAASLFASNIGAEHFVGQAGAAVTNGMAIGLYEWLASYVLLLLGWVFAPVYLSAKLHTIPEYLERRFNKHCRYLFVMLTMVAYIVTKIGATLYAGAVILDVVAGLSIWQSSPLVILATASYTISGGLTAVMLTDSIQTVIFLVGGLIGTGYSLHLVGGLFSMFDKLSSEEIGLGRLQHVLRPANDRDVPWPGMLFGVPTISLWYWCIDQEMAQRVLSARSLSHARAGSAAAAMAKLIPAFITVVPGLVARTLFELCRADETGSTFPEWCESDLTDAKEADKAYPLMVLREFPHGVRGLMVASFVAAMMSSLSSVYNSASTIFTYDVYERFFAKEGGSSEARLVTVGRLVTVVVTGFTFLWLPVVKASSRGLYVVGQEAMSHLVPTVAAVFVCGIFVPFANGTAALSGMLSGILFGIARAIPYFLLQGYCDDYVDPVTETQSFNALNWVVCLNFNYFGLILFFVVVSLICIISYFTERPSESQTQGLLSTLVHRELQKGQNNEVQLTNVRYTSMQQNESQNSESGMNEEEQGYVQKSGVLVEQPSLRQRVMLVFDVDNGYLAHILSVVAIVATTVAIAVFH